jgi:hypothetical protein
MINPNRETYERAKAALEKAHNDLDAAVAKMQDECDHPFEAVVEGYMFPDCGTFSESRVCTLCGYSEFYGHHSILTRLDYRKIEQIEAQSHYIPKGSRLEQYLD